MNVAPVELRSTVTCPACGHAAVESMPTDACRYLYDCPACGVWLKPRTGDCCAFCSYGSVPCPPIQEARRRDGRPPLDASDR